MTTYDCFLLSKSATRSRAESHRSLLDWFDWMRASSSSRSPRSRCRPTELSAFGRNEFLFLRHRDERVAAARRGKPVELFGRHVDAVEARNARAALHTEQLHIRGVILFNKHSRVTQRATDMPNSFFPHALRLAPLAIVEAQCHQPPLTQFLAGPFSLEHTSSVSESLI